MERIFTLQKPRSPSDERRAPLQESSSDRVQRWMGLSGAKVMLGRRSNATADDKDAPLRMGSLSAWVASFHRVAGLAMQRMHQIDV